MLRWNKYLWLDARSHVASSNQSKPLILVNNSYATLKFVYEIDLWVP